MAPTLAYPKRRTGPLAGSPGSPTAGGPATAAAEAHPVGPASEKSGVMGGNHFLAPLLRAVTSTYIKLLKAHDLDIFIAGRRAPSPSPNFLRWWARRSSSWESTWPSPGCAAGSRSERGPGGLGSLSPHSSVWSEGTQVWGWASWQLPCGWWGGWRLSGRWPIRRSTGGRWSATSARQPVVARCARPHPSRLDSAGSDRRDGARVLCSGGRAVPLVPGEPDRAGVRGRARPGASTAGRLLDLCTALARERLRPQRGPPAGTAGVPSTREGPRRRGRRRRAPRPVGRAGDPRHRSASAPAIRSPSSTGASSRRA